MRNGFDQYVREIEKMNQLAQQFGGMDRLMEQASLAARMFEHDEAIKAMSQVPPGIQDYIEQLTKTQDLFNHSALSGGISETLKSMSIADYAKQSALAGSFHTAAGEYFNQMNELNRIGSEIRGLTAMVEISSQQFTQAMDLGRKYSGILSSIDLQTAIRQAFNDDAFKASQAITDQINALSGIANNFLSQDQYRSLFDEQQWRQMKKTVRRSQRLAQRMQRMSAAKRYKIYLTVLAALDFYLQDLKNITPDTSHYLGTVLLVLHLLVIITDYKSE